MGYLATFVIRLTFLVGLFGGVVHDPARSAWVPAYEPVTQDLRLQRVAVVGDSYTTGTDEGGLGTKCWTARAWRTLDARGLRLVADVAAEGRAGYGVRGDHGSLFEDLTARAVKPDDALVVFFGSRNDEGVDPALVAEKARDSFDLARRYASSAKFLVIGPPWPSADVPLAMLRIRDALNVVAQAVGAAFVDPIADRWFVDRPDLIGVDGVHPNDAGHKYLADKIAPLIRAQLSS